MATASQNLEIPAANNINHHVKTVRENCKKKIVSHKGHGSNYSKAALYQMFLKCCCYIHSIRIILDLIKHADWESFK